jgi:hypothetical protein
LRPFSTAIVPDATIAMYFLGEPSSKRTVSESNVSTETILAS